MINKIKRWLGIHIHEWSKWHEVSQTWHSCYTTGARVPDSEYIRIFQTRQCKTCGLTEKK